jgi:flagellin-like hook-associated protein FlgL
MRVSTFSTFRSVLLGVRANQLAGLRAQSQISSGRRILRPSDDPAGTARALGLQQDLAQVVRTDRSITAGRTRLEFASTTLLHGSELLTRTRELFLQAMSGALIDEDRATIATELRQIREQLLDTANAKLDGNYLFSGTALGTKPWVEVTSGGATHVVYRGNGEEQVIQTGQDERVGISAVGTAVFGGATPGPVRFDGLTGVRSGTTADEGSGYADLVFRHDGTDTGTLGSVGVASIDGGNGDTLLGSNALVIDAAANTVRLGNGPAITIPAAGARTDVTVKNELGGELHLDFEGWNGSDFNGNVLGRGSVSIDGATFTTLSFAETDLELRDPNLGQVLHLDTRGVLRAGTELATFGDTVNPFDLLEGAIDDLENDQDLDSPEFVRRLSVRMETLDRVHDDVLLGIGRLGARSARLLDASARQGELGLQIQGRLSDIVDVDLSEAAIDFSRSQMTLELAQAAGARIMQTSLLNFLG